jgi:hypothetical protein
MDELRLKEVVCEMEGNFGGGERFQLFTGVDPDGAWTYALIVEGGLVDWNLACGDYHLVVDNHAADYHLGQVTVTYAECLCRNYDHALSGSASISELTMGRVEAQRTFN